MKDHLTRESRCLNCGKILDAAMNADADENVSPDPGDITICAYCNHLMAYAEDMTLRELTSEEMSEVAGDKHVLRAIGAVAAVMRRRQ